jgi:2,3-dihydroxyethylbenzene 1,2-dioxygenase
MSGVTELGYIGIGIKDEKAWVDFATKIVGLELLDEGLEDRFFLRMDLWHHRIAVHRNAGDDLLYLGWRVADEVAFKAMARTLETAEIDYRIASQAEAEERYVLGLIKLKDPAGIATEIFYGPEISMQRPFHPGRPLHGAFSTGAGGLGHCIVNQPDPDAAYAFYRALGLTGGVDYKIGPREAPEKLKLTFMRCNDRQHSIAWGNVGGSRKAVNHLMLEYTELYDFGYTYDLIRQHQIPVAMALGVHSNDRVLSFYAANPSGWLWEFGTPSGKPAPMQQEYYREDIFGHQIEARGYIFGEPQES